MPDPKALSPEQIELLRGLPGREDEPRRFTRDEFRVAHSGWPPYTAIDLFVRDGRSETWRRSYVADTLLATIDSAVAAERERVLNEVERIHGQLRLRRDEAQDMAERFKDDSERMAANCFDTAAADLKDLIRELEG